MDELKKLLENAGVINEMRRFDSEGDMLRYIVKSIRETVRQVHDEEYEDAWMAIEDLKELLEIIDSASIRK